MQQNGALYQRSNGVQRRDAKQVLDEFAPLFRWRADGQDSLLDIGCGTGDVTIDFVLPLMPSRFSRLVGADLSDGMLAHARSTYPVSAHSRISFRKLDIGSSTAAHGGKAAATLGPDHQQPFDHITSFYCLHWVQDQRQAMKNIYNLLAPGGDCLLAFLAQNPIFEIYKRMATNRKWAPFMTDVQRFISPYQHSASPADDLSKMLYLAGFTEYRVVVREKQFVYDGLDVLKKSVRAVTPFLDRMPSEIHEEFLDDYIDIVSSMQLTDVSLVDGSDCKFRTPYKLIVAYASK